MTNLRPIALPGGFTPVPLADQPSPMLQWVALADMRIDDAYQRPINQNGWATIRKIAANFSWACFNPVLLAPIDGGKFAIIDGQHRAHAALLCGIEQVPAQIVLTPATGQAHAFLQVNTARTSVSAFAIYRAALAARIEWAIIADRAVADADCRLMSFHPSSKSKQPGQIFAVGLIRDLVTRGHAASITTTLRAIRAVDPGGATAILLYSDWILNPLLRAVTAFPGLTEQALTDVLHVRRPAVVLDAAERLSKTEHRGASLIARELFTTAIRTHLQKAAA